MIEQMLDAIVQDPTWSVNRCTVFAHNRSEAVSEDVVLILTLLGDYAVYGPRSSDLIPFTGRLYQADK